MAQTILLFRINRDKYAVIQNVCRTLGIRIIDVARKDYSQKLGTLAQIQGFTREAKKYDGPEFPAEMLIFSEMNSDQVDVFLAEYKKSGQVKVLIVTGCLAQRYRQEILDEIPEVDEVLGTTAYDKILDAVDRALEGEQGIILSDLNALPVSGAKRLVTTGGHFAYLKIAEGCDKHLSLIHI